MAAADDPIQNLYRFLRHDITCTVATRALPDSPNCTCGLAGTWRRAVNPAAAGLLARDDQHEANLRSGDTGVRWQAEMEEHLQTVRGFTHEGILPGVSADQAALRSALAQANATAALALSIANTGGDLELALVRAITP